MFDAIFFIYDILAKKKRTSKNSLYQTMKIPRNILGICVKFTNPFLTSNAMILKNIPKKFNAYLKITIAKNIEITNLV